MATQNIKTIKRHFFSNYTATAVASRGYIVMAVSIIVHIFGLSIRHQQALTAVKRHESYLENEPADGLLCDFVFLFILPEMSSLLLYETEVRVKTSRFRSAAVLLFAWRLT